MNDWIFVQMEEKPIVWCKTNWDRNKIFTRGVVFRQAFWLFPSHCGGTKNPKIFTALKQWFCGGFKKRLKLSKRRVSSTGQKIPKGFEGKTCFYHRTCCRSHTPIHRGDGLLAQCVTCGKMGSARIRCISIWRTVAMVSGDWGNQLIVERLAWHGRTKTAWRSSLPVSNQDARWDIDCSILISYAY